MLDIPAIKARCEAATPKPWVSAPEPGCIANSYLTKLIARVMPLDKLGELRANTEFIAHARSDIPELVTALAEAHKLLEECGGDDDIHNWYVEGEEKGQHAGDCLGCRINTFLGESQ